MGVVGGLEPQLWNQGFSTSVPKAAAFLDVHARGRRASYDADLSVHRLQPREALLTHTFVGLTQSLRVDGVRLRQDLQVDEDPVAGGWRVSRLRVRGSVALPSRVELFASYRLRQPYLRWSSLSAFGDRREHVALGLGRWGRMLHATAEASLDRYELGDQGLGVSGSVAVPNSALQGWGFGITGNYRTRDGLRSWFVAPNLSRIMGQLHVRGAFQHYRVEIGGRPLMTNGGDVSLSAPLGRAMRIHARARYQRLDFGTSLGLFTGLSWRF